MCGGAVGEAEGEEMAEWGAVVACGRGAWILCGGDEEELKGF